MTKQAIDTNRLLAIETDMMVGDRKATLADYIDQAIVFTHMVLLEDDQALIACLLYLDKATKHHALTLKISVCAMIIDNIVQLFTGSNPTETQQHFISCFLNSIPTLHAKNPESGMWQSIYRSIILSALEPDKYIHKDDAKRMRVMFYDDDKTFNELCAEYDKVGGPLEFKVKIGTNPCKPEDIIN